jgi:hypothetical protein
MAMASVNVSQRDTIERAYPREAFAQDAARNAQTTNEVVSGVRVLLAPNERASSSSNGQAGTSARRRRRHFSPRSADANYRPTTPYRQHRPPPGGRRLCGEIVIAAREFGYDAAASPGRGDPRIRGLRQ